MKFILLGSGGASKFPRPTCFCRLCEKARKKGIPYSRTGPSLYLEDESVLFDTPEEISEQINREKIKKINHVFYTHWHPDHTQGMRIFEHLSGDRLLSGRRQKRPSVTVYIPSDVLPDFKKYLPNFFYHQEMGWMKIKNTFDRQKVKVGKTAITPLNLGRGKDRPRYAYLIEPPKKRAVYAPCSIYSAQIDDFYQDLDLLLLETGWFGNTQKVREDLPNDHVWQDHVSLEETLQIIKKIHPRQAILVHLEGSRHVDYDQLKEKIKPFAQKLPLKVGFDGMRIEV